MNVLLLDTILVEDMRQLYKKMGCRSSKPLDMLRDCKLDNVQNLKMLNVSCSETAVCPKNSVCSEATVHPEDGVCRRV